MYRIINGTVSAEAVKLETDVAGAAGSHDDVVLRLKFDDVWDGLEITALWINSRGEDPVYTLVSTADGMADILIPAEPKAYPGECVFCLKGVTVESTVETRATVTVSTRLRVLPSLYAEDAQFPEDITAELFNQLRAEFDGEIGDLDSLMTTYKDDLVGALNEVYISSGATNDYTNLNNKPSINSVTLSGNKTTVDLGISYGDISSKPSINSVTLSGNKTTSDLGISYSDVSNKPKINNYTLSGNVTLANIGAQSTANLVTSITNSSTNTQYPSAKAVYDLVIGAMGGEY